MEAEKKQFKAHTLSLGAERLAITGVEEVKSFDPKMVVLALQNRNLTVKGEDLKVVELTISGGSFAVTGKIDSMVYSHGGSSSFIKKLMK